MKYQDLEYLISQPRLHRYLLVCGNFKGKAQKLYRANLRIAQAFYPVLNLFEVGLRNVLHYRLSTHFGNPNWIINITLLNPIFFVQTPKLNGFRHVLSLHIFFAVQIRNGSSHF